MPTGSIWSRPAPGERRASLTREQIAATAMALVDEEGVAALSMRRIAQALGVGTMTLYHYVRTKDELLELIDDAMMGELLVDDDELPADDWRAALTAIALRSREVHRRHPWVGGLGNRIGPNGLRHFEQSLAAVAGTGLGPEERLDVVSLIDEYVFGFGVRAAVGPGDPGSEDSVFREMRSYVEEQLKSGEFPHIEALFPPGVDRAEVWQRFQVLERDEHRFRRGLDRLLDGIALDLERRGLPQAAAERPRAPGHA
jgi:AcrR family transcriptional regulator